MPAQIMGKKPTKRRHPKDMFINFLKFLRFLSAPSQPPALLPSLGNPRDFRFFRKLRNFRKFREFFKVFLFKDNNKEKIKQAIKKTSSKNYNALNNWKDDNPDFSDNENKSEFFSKTISTIGKQVVAVCDTNSYFSSLSDIKALPILFKRMNLFLPDTFFLSCPRCFIIDTEVIFLGICVGKPNLRIISSISQ